MLSSKYKTTIPDMPLGLSDFDPLYLPDIKERSFWESLPEDYRHERLKLAEDAYERDWPEILMSDYLRFSKDGNRVEFEDKYFTRRRMLTSLVMGECIEGNGRFLQKIIDGIYLILGETTWCLPAHNSYIRDTKQFTIPDTGRPVVDLFSGETAAILSVSEELLRPALSKESPFISAAIDNALHERVLDPYLRFHFWWMGNGLEPMCNWTPWITQNVLLTAFTRPVGEEPAILSDVISSKKEAQKNGNTRKSIFRESSRNTDSNSSIMSSHDVNAELSDVSAFSNSVMSSKKLSERFSDEDGRVNPPDWETKHLLPTPEDLHQIYDSAVKSVHHFLSEYAMDGCCDEGAQYYSHAGLCLFGCLSILKSISERKGLLHQSDNNSSQFNKSDSLITGSDFAGSHHLIAGLNTYDSSENFPDFQQEFSSETEKIKNIATYIMKVHVGGEYYINFADCSPKAGRRGAREYLFGAFIHDTNMCDFAAEDYRSESWTERLNPSEENLWYHVLNARCHRKMMEHTPGICEHEKADAWFPGTGLMVARDKHYVLAVKAGDNADSHNHNDVGSFILYKNGKPFIIDLGVGSYTQKTFSKDRYDIWTMQSQYHNLPSFYDGDGNIIMEHDGEKYCAVNVSCRMDEKSSELSMELQDAYSGLDRKLTRSVRLLKNTDTSSEPVNNISIDTESRNAPVVLSDHYDGKLKFTENIICYEKPEPEELCRDTACSERTLRIGNVGKIKAFGFSDIKIEELPITDPRLGETWKHSCYRVQLTASVNDVSLIFT